MSRIAGSIWVILLWLFLLMIPVEFYLAGHGAMDGAHAAHKAVVGMKTAWDPHSFFGTLMLLLSLLTLLVALLARPPRRLLLFNAGLFVFMVIQFLLPLLNGSASTRWLAALHGVNALVVTGLAIMLTIRSFAYGPLAPARSAPDGDLQRTGAVPG